MWESEMRSSDVDEGGTKLAGMMLAEAMGRKNPQNIPANEQVQIQLVYATELSEDEEHDSIRFHLPVHIGSRYRQAPFVSGSTDISLVQDPVLEYCPKCRGYCTYLKNWLDPIPPACSNCARISLSSDAVLDKDFAVIRRARRPALRCRAPPTADTVALALTLVPRFKLPDLSRQKFVFLVDRSGSRKALVITSFGSRTSALWADGSRPYNQDTLDEATLHVDGMAADYDGTQIQAALKHCSEDGNGVLSEVKAAVAAAPETMYLRVSVLGIGNSALGLSNLPFGSSISRRRAGAAASPLAATTVSGALGYINASGASRASFSTCTSSMLKPACTSLRLQLAQESDAFLPQGAAGIEGGL
ncbi:hypothetical protein C8R43DRAFT_952226 [Mycena crocata]|nr:hypothetical protein C8R43DRAFT_952226 [Mycena crocata]